MLRDVVLFAWSGSGIQLRSYQVQVARTIVDSVVQRKGLTIVVVFPRQSGKNELQAQIETYLLTLYSPLDAEIVKVSPTWKPQTLNAMRRLQRVLERNFVTGSRWQKESGYIYKMERARIFFLSGEQTTNVVGATASTLLECDEAQDVTIAKWDKDFAPMAASTNATRVFWGTTWTSRTLLARELRAAREAEARDGQRRVFVLDADQVAREVPPYGHFVSEQVARLGRDHPFVRTQYFSEEIDAEGGMFTRERQALMQGQHAKSESPQSGKSYALLLDIAGEDETANSYNDAGGDPTRELPLFRGTALSGRDATALTVVEVDLSTLTDELVRAASYSVVYRQEWVGIKHTLLYACIKALAEHWKARYLVVDATGVGAGLASFLDKALPGCVIPFIFTARSKSDLGWKFLSIIETGRYKEYHPAIERDSLPSLKCQVELNQSGVERDPLQEEFWRQVQCCQSTVLEGPGKLMRWGVPDGTRDPQTGDLVHDDLLVSAALCGVLDSLRWGVGASEIIRPENILGGMRESY